MDDNASTPSSEIPPPPPPAPRRTSWGWLLVLVLAGLIGAGAWLVAQYQRQLIADLEEQQRLSQRLAGDLATLRRDAAVLDTRQADFATASQRNSAGLADLARRIDEHDQVVGQLKEEITGGHQRFQLAAVEQLLLLANDRVLLARDAQSALVALEAADQRLAGLADPRLFNVREALARERAALAAVPRPDLTAATLTLANLIERVPRLPLAARVPERYQSPPVEQGPAPASGWWEQTKASVLRALKGTFAVRRNRGPVPQLLATDQETLVYQVLMLKLEGARVALLRGDNVAFRDLAESAQRWIGEWFRKDDPGVLAAQAELERLQPLDLAPPLPDISRGLVLLRAQLQPAPQ